MGHALSFVAGAHQQRRGTTMGGSPAEMDTWITDTEISTRFPYYTRANADEVGPEPFSPLGWSLAWMKGCIPGVAEGFVRFGVVPSRRVRRRIRRRCSATGVATSTTNSPCPGSWASACRVRRPKPSTSRTSGTIPECRSTSPNPTDEDEVQSAKLAETMGWAMSTTCVSGAGAGVAPGDGTRGHPSRPGLDVERGHWSPGRARSPVPNSMRPGPSTASRRSARRSGPAPCRPSVRRSGGG